MWLNFQSFRKRLRPLFDRCAILARLIEAAHGLERADGPFDLNRVARVLAVIEQELAAFLTEELDVFRKRIAQRHRLPPAPRRTHPRRGRRGELSRTSWFSP